MATRQKRIKYREYYNRLERERYRRQTSVQRQKYNIQHAKAAARRSAKKLLGISLEQLNELKAKGCQICGTVLGRMVIDHCHKSGKGRGILCANCNGKLGWFEKNQEGIYNYLWKNI